MMPIKKRCSLWVIPLLLVLISSGCSGLRQGMGDQMTELNVAQQIPDEETLLDVGVLVFDLDGKAIRVSKKDPSQEDIKQAERHFIPYHLKKTMEESGHFGMVRVVPSKTEAMDVLVEGALLDSGAGDLVMRIQVTDAEGREWFKKNYRYIADDKTFAHEAPPGRDTYQDVYHRIVNDIIEFMYKLLPDERKKIRQVARMRYAASISPQPFETYIEEVRKGRYEVKRLPAEGDPAMERVLSIREREYLLLDTIDQHYERLYVEMQPHYRDWREMDFQEAMALKEAKRQKWTRIGTGAALIVGAILLEGNADGAWDSNVIRDIMVIGGLEVIISGVNISKQVDIHEASLQELSDGFSAEVQPVTVEVAGKVVQLTGTAEEQMAQFKTIMRDLYQEETGIDESGELVPDPESSIPNYTPQLDHES